MALFRSELHQDIWIEHHCERCYFKKDECRILDRALKSGRKPVAWERNTRKNVTMAETMKCNQETRTPPKVGVPGVVADETMFMFDVESTDAAMDSDHA